MNNIIIQRFGKDILNDVVVIRERFKNQVAEWEIIKWLENFKEDEWNLAIQLLKNFQYINEEEIIEILEKNLKKVTEKYKDEIAIWPILDENYKSGTLMLYFLVKCESYKNNKKRIKIVQNKDMQNEIMKSIDSYVVIFIDDLVASGHTAINYIKKYISHDTTVVLLCVIYTNKAKAYAKKHGNIIIFGECREKTFRKRTSIFRNEERMKRIRDFSYSYGKKLCQTMPLGYGNTQLLIAFSHTCPNSTLPIFWADNESWNPLFPRFYGERVDRSKKKRNEIARDLSLFKHTKYSKLLISGISAYKFDGNWKEYRYIKQTDFILYSLLLLLNERKSSIIICQILGLFKHDFDEYFELGIKKKIFNNDKTISKLGKQILLESSWLRHEFLKKENRLVCSIEKNDYLYIPNEKRAKGSAI